MTFEEISNRNLSGGINQVFIYVADIEPIFFPLILFSIFIITSIGSFLAQKNLTGRGNIKASLAVAGFIVTIIAYIMSIIPLINIFTVIVCFIVTTFFVLLLLLPKSRE